MNEHRKDPEKDSISFESEDLDGIAGLSLLAKRPGERAYDAIYKAFVKLGMTKQEAAREAWLRA